jgi:hypothetical protein
MTAPAKKNPAKATPPEEGLRTKKKATEEKPKPRAKPRDEDDEDEDEKPRAKKKPRDEDEEEERPKARKKPRDEDEEDEKPKAKKKPPVDEDEDEDEGDDDFSTDGKAAKQLGLDPGFRNRGLMKQVTKELSGDEVLHYVCRPSEVIAKKQAMMALLGGIFFALIAAGIGGVMLYQGSKNVPTATVLIPCMFILVGIFMAVYAPIAVKRQARLGWYAVTDRRAIVFHIGLWGSSGKVTTYHPAELRNMWVRKSFWLKGGGDVVFKTIITTTTKTTRDRRTGHTSTSTSTSKQHFGFLGVEDANDVEALIREVLLSRGRRRDDDDDEDDDD